ncbi:MAG TPA: flagellar biosynthesis anti-sigma factor FlgM [Bacillota bacterium]|nr:flagellar biosynthesis anti-sigma factor FlgM [Bacillota bacterium]
MKIFGPGQSRLSAYQNQRTYQVDQQKKAVKEDQLQISKEAKNLQKGTQSTNRDLYIKQIKHDVETGNYSVDVDKTAQKLMNYWSGQ